jgi:TonB family protein
MPSKALDEAPQFGVLEPSREERRRRRISYGVSWLVQVPLSLLILWFLAAPPRYREPEGRKGIEVTLITPPTTIPSRQRKLLRLPARRPASRTVDETTSIPKLLLPREARVIPPKPRRITVPLPDTPPIVPPKTAVFKPIVPKWKPQTHVGAFESSSALATVLPGKKPQAHLGGFDGGRATANLKLPPEKVQTGGFGNPNGIAGEAKNKGSVAHLGSFDKPEGPGSGNGTGGAQGARGLVASAGFGNGIAAEPNGADTSGSNEPRSAGFTDAQSMPRAVARLKTQPQVAAFVPVEITSKPDPVYSDEARRLHIQGEVVLRVDFTASGRVEVLGVEQRLGHGLDEAAARAAQQIQFKPARRNGRPVDTDATLRILFRLAD